MSIFEVFRLVVYVTLLALWSGQVPVNFSISNFIVRCPRDGPLIEVPCGADKNRLIWTILMIFHDDDLDRLDVGHSCSIENTAGHEPQWRLVRPYSLSTATTLAMVNTLCSKKVHIKFHASTRQSLGDKRLGLIDQKPYYQADLTTL